MEEDNDTVVVDGGGWRAVASGGSGEGTASVLHLHIILHVASHERIGWSTPVIEMMDGCYCAKSSSSTTSFHDSIVDYCSPPGMASYDVEAFMRVNLLLLNEPMWEAGSK
uniref:Uncharacterized protein n=1 Tax=Oryza nivara TaxID=4536 RepID=A0A0E0HDV9_ORYNI